MYKTLKTLIADVLIKTFFLITARAMGKIPLYDLLMTYQFILSQFTMLFRLDSLMNL